MSGQIEILANAARTGLQDDGLQLQATYKMTLQNRLVLDLMLSHERRLCGYLNLNDRLLYSHPQCYGKFRGPIRIKQVAKSSHDLKAAMETEWLNKILHGIGFSLTGWLASLLWTVIIIVIIIIVICNALSRT